MSQAAPESSVLATRRGKLILALLCGVAFLDFVDASIVNVALPSIRTDLGFSVQNLQWVLSGYLLTYGGFMLLGGRAADLLGRRRVLLAGILVFALSSLTGGVAQDPAMLVAARLVQGIGAAMMVPAALSILTTTFSDGTDRHKALGAWGGIAGLASAVGVFLGGLLTEEASWRWLFWVNLPVSALLLAFILNESRHANPLAPLSIFRINGLGAANAAQVMAIGAFYAMFFFLTLYMQNVLGFSQLQAGSAYLPATAGVAISSGIASQLFARIGTRPIIVTGALISSGAVYWLSRIPVHGSYLGDLLPALLIMSFGLGFVFVGVSTAANAGVPPDKAGLAIFSVIATSRTHHLLAAGATQPDALTSGFHRALAACSIFLIAAAAIALRATNTRGEPAAGPALEAVPATDNA